MSYQEERQIRIRRQRSKQAVALAMEGRWREALAANQEIIASFPSDVEAYNRLGKAHLELGEYALASEAYGRAAEMDPYNMIARKNLRRLSHLEGAPADAEVDARRVEPHQFIEETGKAGVVSLRHLAPQEVLARVVAGDKVGLLVEGSRLTVVDGAGQALGQVDSRHEWRLIKMMAGGNKYETTVISSAEDELTVIIREVYQHPSQAGQLSFPSRGKEEARVYPGDRLLRREPDYEASPSDDVVESSDEVTDEV
ncbi:MAG: tetratricopeptide repeat protein [Chloroflexota bacterium]